jgi:hypothetical protein
LPKGDIGKAARPKNGGIGARAAIRQEVAMLVESEFKVETNREQATDHLLGVHFLLQALQDKIGEHPLLAEAIVKVEMALNTLGVKTAGML